MGFSKEEGPTMMLNYLTPHGKWHINSTYGDNERMTVLSRGCEPLWISEKDAAELDINDNDWVEVHNDNGVVVTRAVVSARIPRGICIQYHSPERSLNEALSLGQLNPTMPEIKLNGVEALTGGYETE